MPEINLEIWTPETKVLQMWFPNQENNVGIVVWKNKGSAQTHEEEQQATPLPPKGLLAQDILKMCSPCSFAPHQSRFYHMGPIWQPHHQESMTTTPLAQKKTFIKSQPGNAWINFRAPNSYYGVTMETSTELSQTLIWAKYKKECLESFSSRAARLAAQTQDWLTPPSPSSSFLAQKYTLRSSLAYS